MVKAVDNKLTETKLKTEFENLKESNFLTKLFLYYQKYLQFNESYQVIMNIVLVVLFVAFLIIQIILYSRNKKKNLIMLIKSLMKAYVDQIQKD